MTDFLDKQCDCAECTAFAQNEAEQCCATTGTASRPSHGSPNQAECEHPTVTLIDGAYWKCDTCTSPYYDGRRMFDTSPLGFTDALGHDRDESERNRASARQTCPHCGDSWTIADDRMDVCTRCWRDPRQPSDAPTNSQTCSLCGALHGRWVKTHTLQGETRPCKGSW